MFNKIRYNKYILSIVLSLIICLFIVPPTLATQSVGNQILGGANQTGQETFEETAAPKMLAERLIEIVNNLLVFLGVLFFLIMLYGGWQWMNARGNEEQVSKAKVIIRDAVIGLVIIFIARIVTQFILMQIGTALS
jgi:cbb3-type cytochrome oxidase subunit 3